MSLPQVTSICSFMRKQVTLSLSLSLDTRLLHSAAITSRNVTRPRTRLLPYTVLSASPSPEVFTGETGAVRVVVVLPPAAVLETFFAWSCEVNQQL